MVKYVRNNFLLPECTILDLDQFNATLWEMAEEDRDRTHYKKKVNLMHLFEDEQKEWLILPEKEFECAIHQELKSDKYGMVNYDTKVYSTSPRYARQVVKVQVTYNTVAILNDQNEVIVKHSRLYGIKRQSMIWQPYLDLLSRRPRAIKYTSIYEQFPPEWTEYLRRCTENEQKEVLKFLGSLLKNDDFTLLQEALVNASRNGHPSADQIKHCFYSLLNQDHQHQAITVQSPIPDMPNIQRGLSHYDAFFQPEGES
ncbi:Mu transposase domain-containing protein [Rossellomorea aquimaris]|nr:hypothetical protein [Rossellomorea aquimaris]